MTYQILVKPAWRRFGGRLQWKFELRAANGRRIDPRDTYANRDEASAPLVELVSGTTPVELVVQNRFGLVEDRIKLR